ncbi:MAG: site-specific integrase [Candidatus Omnitrophica bacterium]|nr:site-specific integrase [Candidatus Omnitrophota bacterium]
MATIFKRGKKWGISYLNPQGKRIRKIVSPYKETAQKILKKIETQLIEGKYLDINDEEKETADISFKEFSLRYIDMHIKLHNKNHYGQKGTVQLLINHFNDQRLNEIDRCAIQSFMAKRIKEIKPSSVNREISMLSSMYNRAIEWGVYKGSNPAKGIKKLPENNQRTRWLTRDEQSRLLNQCHGLTKVIVLIALNSGMRWREIINLKWKQSQNSNYIDLQNEVFFIHESQSKSKKSRYIPMAKSVKEILKNVSRGTSEYIFLNNKTGKPFGSIKFSYKKALRMAEIKDFTFHDLRHTFASNLVMKGVDLYVVQKLLGHATINMTQRYAHLHPHQFRDAIRKLENDSLLLEEINYNEDSKNVTDLAHRLIFNEN